MYESIKCHMNNLLLKLTLTLTDPVTPYFIHHLVNKLVNRGRSVAGFEGEALRDFERFLQQFVRMFI